MSAAEVIERIKTLPPEELEIVREFLRNGAGDSPSSPAPKYIDRESARQLGAKVMEENADLFRKLAQ